MVDSLPGFPESRSTLEAVDIVCGTLQAKLITKELLLLLLLLLLSRQHS